MRVLTLDIETAPSLAYAWGLHDQHIGLPQLVEPTTVLCFAAKWLDSPRVEFRSVYHDGHDEMVRRAHELMSEADAIVTFNGRSFDCKHLRREFILAGLTPPAPHADIDLYLAVRKQFRFLSNKLQHVAEQLGLGSKTKHTGFQLWVDCLTGDDATKAKAWRLMRAYNVQDVRLTEALYLKLLPWIPNHPNAALHNAEHGVVSACQRCGSFNLQRRGYAVTTLGKYGRVQCTDCGAWGREAKRVAGADARAIG
jgi:hypothetical protein